MTDRNNFRGGLRDKGWERLPKGENLVSYKTNHPYIRITNIENNQIKKINYNL